MYNDYDRYSPLRNSDNSVIVPPFIDIPVNSSDKYEYWNINYSRLDKLSMKYYRNPFYDFLILYANNIYLNEFDIPDNVIIRIPFPLSKALADYESALMKYNY